MHIERDLTSKEIEETNWWQEIENLAYFLDGQAPEDFDRNLSTFLDNTHATDGRGSLEDFKRYAVIRIMQILKGGPEPQR